jgi:hypothetical protein
MQRNAGSRRKGRKTGFQSVGPRGMLGAPATRAPYGDKGLRPLFDNPGEVESNGPPMFDNCAAQSGRPSGRLQ